MGSWSFGGVVATGLVVAGCAYDWSAYEAIGSAGGGATSASSSAAGSAGSAGGGGASGATSSAASGGGATSSASTGSGTVVLENCHNGGDDDGDGLADCPADPKCGCAPFGPPAWKGPYDVFLADGSVPLPDCASLGDTLEEDVYAGENDAGPASCGACACSTPAGTCGAPSLKTYSDPQCSILVEDTSAQPGCHGLLLAAAVVAGEPPVVASCAPSSPATLGGFTWDTHGRVCDPGKSSAGCGGDVCVSKAASFKTCIRRGGDVSCPPAWPDKHLVYTSFTDDRRCEGCACGAPQGTSCDGTISVHGDGACTALQTSFSPPEACLAVTAAQSYDYAPGAPQGGKCAASGAPTPAGSVSGNGEATLCCL